jgi:hypothetical protein
VVDLNVAVVVDVGWGHAGLEGEQLHERKQFLSYNSFSHTVVILLIATSLIELLSVRSRDNNKRKGLKQALVSST